MQVDLDKNPIPSQKGKGKTIKLITTIAGNLSVTEVTKNTLNFLQAIEKRNIPVALGANKPLEREKDNSNHGAIQRGDVSR